MGIVFMLLVFVGPRLAKVFKADHRPPDVPVRQEFDQDVNEIIRRDIERNHEAEVDEEEEIEIEERREKR